MYKIFRILFLIWAADSAFAGWVKNNTEIKYIPDQFMNRVIDKLRESDRYDDFLGSFNSKINSFIQNCNSSTNYVNLDRYNNKNETQNLLMLLFGEEAKISPTEFNKSSLSISKCLDIMKQFKRNPKIIGNLSKGLIDAQSGDLESELGESNKTVYTQACDNFDKALNCFISNKNRILARSAVQNFQAVDSPRFKKYSAAIKACLIKKHPISHDDFIKLCKLRESDVYYSFSDSTLAKLNEFETLNDKISFIQSPFFKPNLKQAISSCFEYKWVEFLKKRYIDGVLKECDDVETSIHDGSKYKSRENIDESKQGGRASSIGH